MKQSRKGFTLVELLVVVLIIGVLAAIALPQYQKAVLRSRYNGMMPLAKAIAQGEEAYYMDNGQYSSEKSELDIKGDEDVQTIQVSPDSAREAGFSYVLATRPDLPGLAYVVYLTHSEQFPDVIMCEANDTLNPLASWLCGEGLHGTPVSNGSLLGDDWTAYILTGEQGSSKFTSCMGAKPKPITAGQSGATGVATCNEETGKYEYEWTGGDTYVGSYQTCTANAAYDCAGGVFSRSLYAGSICYGSEQYGCTGSVFQYSDCVPTANYGCAGTHYGAGSRCNPGQQENQYGCANSSFESTSYCYGRNPYSCDGSTFKGNSHCEGVSEYACNNATFYAGTYCLSNATHGCEGTQYPQEIDGEGNITRGCCKIQSILGKCPSGSPKCGSDNKWDGTYW